MKPTAFGAALILALAACKSGEVRSKQETSEARPEPGSEAWLLAEGERYLADAAFRRQALEASLTNPKNVYSMTRLTGYGLVDRGWDLLPEWNPTTQVIDDDYVAKLEAGEAAYLDGNARAIWDGTRPTSMKGWVALGRRMFFQYPLRSEVFAEHALRSKELAQRIGLHRDEDGRRPGLVAFATLDGKTEIGITCALCHVAVENGRRVEGRARRTFDYGEMRLAFYRDTGAFLDEDTKRRMAGWGPGRADITQDDDEDPVAIVDLWGVRNHKYLTQSGTLKHEHPAALAIRQETQILQANYERARPPRELAWAMAMYVYSLRPPEPNPPNNPQQVALGQKLFQEACDHCHSDKSYGGVPLPAAKVGTDPVLARGSARGTGLYRPSPLLGVAQAGPYLHDGSVASLPELFDPARKVPGHRYGMELPKSEKDALLAFLVTL